MTLIDWANVDRTAVWGFADLLTRTTLVSSNLFFCFKCRVWLCSCVHVRDFIYVVVFMYRYYCSFIFTLRIFFVWEVSILQHHHSFLESLKCCASIASMSCRCFGVSMSIENVTGALATGSGTKMTSPVGGLWSSQSELLIWEINVRTSPSTESLPSFGSAWLICGAIRTPGRKG